MISRFHPIKTINFPKFTGLRIMHMPFLTYDPESVRGIADQYKPLLAGLYQYLPTGVGYLTIDEASLKKGEHHRRPGLHVDGVDEIGHPGPWGGGGGYGSNGWLTAATHVGCRAWNNQVIDDRRQGRPGPDGDCEHLREHLTVSPSYMEPGVLYGMQALTLHESVPMREDCNRQFLRISFPNKAAWYDGYTRNPNGIEPQGVIKPRRAHMDYRPSQPLLDGATHRDDYHK